MIENLFLYAVIGFAATIVISLLIKFLFSKNVESVNMSSHLRSNFQKGKNLQEQVKNLVDSGNINEAAKVLENSGKLSGEQSQKVIEMLGRLGGDNVFTNSGGNELLEKVKNLLKENKKIKAIKLVKESGSGSLKDAKDIVDKIESTLF